MKKIVYVCLLFLGLLLTSPGLAKARVSAVSSSQCQRLKGAADPFILVLHKGELVQQAILKCANEAHLNAASLSGLGAFMPVTLRYYDHKAKRYNNKTITEFMEVTNLSGNTTMLGGKRINHIHVTLSDHNFHPVAGHLKEATVGAVLEVTITPLVNRVQKAHDVVIGLDMIKTS